MIKFAELESIAGGVVVQVAGHAEVQFLCIDSRKVGIASGTLFLAIKGDRHDGHDHIRGLYNSGIRQFVVEQDVNVGDMRDANILRVSSSIDALQKIVAHHRQKFTIPVIAITGSNGKTIIKEWLYQMLSLDKVTVKNPGSYNSQVGVPLAVWQMQRYHELGIFEAGISRPGEMEKLQRIIQPTIGIFSNIGSAHDEGFNSRDEKIREKLKLFSSSDVLIYNRDQSDLHRIISDSKLKAFCWGSETGSDVHVKQESGKFKVTIKDVAFYLQIPFEDRASRENIFHCVATMSYMGYTPTVIQQRIDTLRSIAMRMELKDGINRCQVVDDTYNNDLGGLEIALQFLENQHQKTKKRLILSDILESGLTPEELVKSIVSIIRGHQVTSIIGIGPMLARYQDLFHWPSTFYNSTQEFLDAFNFDELNDEIILVKGARKFSFEQIVSRLQHKVHGTVMEIDLDSLVHNFNYFKSRLQPSTKVMVMVKAFAYGSGSVEIANLLQYHQADYLGVAYPDEGIELRKHNIKLPIMVMNPTEESFEAMLAHTLEPEIYSERIFRSLLNFLKGKACRVHLKIDTGMHRLGFEPEQLAVLLDLLLTNKNIHVASVFSHLAGADEHGHDSFSKGQYETFISTADRIAQALGYKPTYHILNTPGILRLPQYQMDMVRLGIGLYGVNPTSDGFEALRPVATLKTIISQIKHVRKGETIGYGRRGIAESDLTMATIAIGYADGFSRAFSRGVGKVLINGKAVPVLGNVCMDMTMVDITGIEASEGDDVIIFGSTFPIRDVAASINTIPYEILTSTSERVKRVFIADGI